MKTCLALLLLLMTSALSAQQYINSSRDSSLRALKQYKPAGKKVKTSVTQTDSTLVLTVSGSTAFPGQFIYHFDADGKCFKEEYLTACRPCYEEYIRTITAGNTYNWKQINENQYISAFEWHMLIEVFPGENPSHLAVIRSAWTRELYDMLSDN